MCNFPKFILRQLSGHLTLDSCFISSSCLLSMTVQYADPTDEPISVMYDQTFEDYDLQVQEWKGEPTIKLFDCKSHRVSI